MICARSSFARSRTTFLSRSCGCHQPIKTDSRTKRSILLGPVGSYVCWKGSFQLLPFVSSSHCQGHSGSCPDRTAETAGESGGRGRLRSAAGKCPARELWPSLRARLQVITTAPTVSSNRKGPSPPPPAPAPVRPSGAGAFPAFPGRKSPAPSLYFSFWPEEKPASNRGLQLMSGAPELMAKHRCSGSNSRKCRKSLAMVKVPDTEVPWKATREALDRHIHSIALDWRGGVGGRYVPESHLFNTVT